MRRPSYYILAMFMPLGLITALAFVQFSTDIDDKSWFVRVDHSVTLLLTAAAYTSAVASSLPEIGYATLLDKYLLSCLLLLALFVIESPVVRIATGLTAVQDSSTEPSDNGIDPMTLDRTFSIALGGVWLALHIATTYKACMAQSHARQRLTEEGLQQRIQGQDKGRRGSLMFLPQAVLDGERGLQVARREGAKALCVSVRERVTSSASSGSSAGAGGWRRLRARWQVESRAGGRSSQGASQSPVKA